MPAPLPPPPFAARTDQAPRLVDRQRPSHQSVALNEAAVKVFCTFGLSDRYTWLQEDMPRGDGAPRRPLPFDADLQPKPA